MPAMRNRLRPSLGLSLRLTLGLSSGLALLGCQSGPPPAPQPVAADVKLDLSQADGSSLDIDAALARGETVALVFWQTWCPSCREEAPLIAAAAKAEGARIRFVSVVPGKTGTVDEAKVEATRAEWGYQGFPLVRDTDLSLSRSLEVRGTPTILVLGKDRQVLYREHRPPADWSALRGAELGALPASAPGEGAQGGAGAPADSPECEGGVCPLPAGS